MRRGLLLTAAALLLATNAWTLIAAWRNRSDARGGTVELTERELRIVEVPWESTVTQLDLRWDVPSDVPEDHHGPAAWLDAAKLAELGYDCTVPLASPDAREHYRALPSALVFLLLEYQSDAGRQADRDRKPGTRLFVVDAGRDPGRLREQYPDPQTHIITRGVVRPFYQEHSIPDGAPLATPRLRGWVETIVPSQIYVPAPSSQVLEEFRRHGPPEPEQAEGEPRFAVTISWGSNYEPWVADVRRLPALLPGPRAQQPPR